MPVFICALNHMRWNILCMFHCFIFSQGKSHKLGIFSQLQWAVSVSVCSITSSLVFPWAWALSCSLSPQAFKVCCSSSVLWDRQDRNHSYRQPPKKSEHWYIFHFSLSLPREKLQVGSFFLTVNSVRLRGRDWHGWNEMTSLTFSMQLFLALQYWDFLIGF